MPASHHAVTDVEATAPEQASSSTRREEGTPDGDEAPPSPRQPEPAAAPSAVVNETFLVQVPMDPVAIWLEFFMRRVEHFTIQELLEEITKKVILKDVPGLMNLRAYHLGNQEEILLHPDSIVGATISDSLQDIRIEFTDTMSSPDVSGDPDE